MNQQKIATLFYGKMIKLSPDRGNCYNENKEFRLAACQYFQLNITLLNSQIILERIMNVKMSGSSAEWEGFICMRIEARLDNNKTQQDVCCIS